MSLEAEGPCPRCGCNEFFERDCGPDSYEDDIFYISYVCKNCGLWNDGWRGGWYVDVTSWPEVDGADEFIGPTPPVMIVV